jgi:hypothetical protein
MSNYYRHRGFWERSLKQVRVEKQIIKQEELQNKRYGLGYNQGIPYQTTPMITKKSNGYTDGLDRLKTFSTSDFNIQSANIPINEVVLQPGPGEGKDIWTTSAYSYTPGGGGPGGGRDNEWLEMGGWGDSYHILIEFDLTNSPPIALSARVELFVGEMENKDCFDTVQHYVCALPSFCTEIPKRNNFSGLCIGGSSKTPCKLGVK